MQVIPSIDVENIPNLKSQIEALIPYYKRFQIDYADGKFVNFTTPPVSDLINSLIQYTGIMFDIHLMTADFHKALNIINNEVADINLGVIFLHHAAKPDPAVFLEQNAYYKLGLVLNPEDSIDTIRHIYNLENIGNIQIMTIVPGPQGSPFIPILLNKIEQLRDAGYKNNIFLDGGVNLDTLKTILSLKHLPNFICPGSFFSKAETVEEQFREISKLLES